MAEQQNFQNTPQAPDPAIPDDLKTQILKDPHRYLSDERFGEHKALDKPVRDAAVTFAFESLLKKEPSLLPYVTNAFDGNPHRDEMLKEMYDKLIKDDPYAIVSTNKWITDSPVKEERFKEALESLAQKNTQLFFIDWNDVESELRDKPYRSEVMDIAAASAMSSGHPEFITNNTTMFEGNPRKDQIIEQAFHAMAAQSPGMILNEPDDYASFKDKPYRQQVIDEAIKSAMVKDPFTILWYEDADPLNKRTDLKTLERDAIDGTSKVKDSALQYVELLDQAHEYADPQGHVRPTPPKVRFASLDNFNATQEFGLITLAREEIFTSTYKGMLDDMLGKLHSTGKSLTDVIAPDQRDQMGVFLEAAATYDRMGDVLKVIPKDKLPGILQDLTDKVAHATDMKDATTVASMLSALKGNNEMRHQLEADVMNGFLHPKAQDEKARQEEQDRFGLIAAAYGQNSHSISDDMKPFFLGMASNPRYKMPDISGIHPDQLTDKNKVNNQLMVFAGDQDGINSFKHFQEQYENKPGWKKEDKGSYIEIESTGGKVPVHIYANKPDKEEEGLEAIRKNVAAEQGSDKPSFQVFIGRGHSYHAEDYLGYLTPEVNLVALGSCGGFQNVDTVLKKAGDSQVISTQGTGTMLVNDPLLFNINQSINQTGSISWPDQQKWLDTHVGSEDREQYLLPDKNVPLMMIKRFNELQKEETAPQKTVSFNLPFADIGDLPQRASIEKQPASQNQALG